MLKSGRKSLVLASLLVALSAALVPVAASAAEGNLWTSGGGDRQEVFKKMNIAVIGAGATGLTAGYELAKRGHRVTI